MALRIDRNEVWHWYNVIEEFHAQKLPAKKFCTAHNHDYKLFSSRYYRIVYKSLTNPDLYKKIVPIARKYLEGDLMASQFVKSYDISIGTLSAMGTHLTYLDIIEEMKIAHKQPPKAFIQVPAKLILSTFPEPPIAELVEKQNDIEIIISKGVKVSIAANIDSMKIIKIIELLKDL